MFISNTDKAKVLVEALPYIQNYYGKTIVVKYGGNAMENEGLKNAVISDLVLLKLVGINVVMVHGGGPEITNMFENLGIESHFINGLRYTSEEAVEVVQMVLAGKTNKDLVNKINSIGGKAVGLSGIDGGMIKAKKLDDGENDYGCVGEITEVDTKIITENINAGFIPVIATVATGIDGESTVYNINADTAAAEIATPNLVNLKENVNIYVKRLNQGVNVVIDNYKKQLLYLDQRLEVLSPINKLDNLYQKKLEYDRFLDLRIKQILNDKKHILDLEYNHLLANNPINRLEAAYRESTEYMNLIDIKFMKVLENKASELSLYTEKLKVLNLWKML